MVPPIRTKLIDFLLNEYICLALYCVIPKGQPKRYKPKEEVPTFRNKGVAKINFTTP